MDLTYDQLAQLIHAKAGVTVDPERIGEPGIGFDELGVDSLGVLGLIAELENRFGLQLGSELPRTPAELLDNVNAAAMKGV
ncbi:acyl carrier protein [Kitasatospora sp. NPDC002227]|uniref:acyl carrier protein n=1 Tax=Kitasatospora sp. NPDC002227 TaxID=3154773 RepID=UPI0033318FE4